MTDNPAIPVRHDHRLPVNSREMQRHPSGLLFRLDLGVDGADLDLVHAGTLTHPGRAA